jgi:hypothetical protein
MQITSEPVSSHNIYCEQKFFSSDGKTFAIERRPFGQPCEIWFCELGKMRLAKAAVGDIIKFNSHVGFIYYFDNASLMRIDMSDMSSKEVYRFEGDEPPCTGGTISPDGKYFVCGPFHVKDRIYSLHVIDLESGKETTLCEAEDMFNPHQQFDPSGSGKILVQRNRGGLFDPEKGVIQLTGPEGATLVLVDVNSGKISPLPVGQSDTPSISGHLCWVGNTGNIIFTTAPGVHKTMLDGTGVYFIENGYTDVKQITSGEPFNHIAASSCGRFYVVDNHQNHKILVGSIESGKFMEICDSKTLPGSPQHVHPHAYMTPDNQYIIYNSFMSGVAQVYAIIHL